jgi:YgiT-type zinc finger domain-containing protein
MICDNCGNKGARVRHFPRTYGKGRSLLVIERVPVIVCPHCGESYMTAETLHALDRIKAKRARIAARRTVSVAAFAN